MSDRPHDRHPPGNPSATTSTKASPTDSPTRAASFPRPPASTRRVTSPVAHHGSVSSLELPPLPHASTASAGSFSSSASRLAGFSSILNPLQSEPSPAPRRRKVSEIESPRSGAPPALPPIFACGPVHTTPGPSPRMHHDDPAELAPRRILTPRSPSLHRAASLGQLNQPSRTIGPPRTPFSGSPRSRTYVIEPGLSGAPPLPGAPAPVHGGHTSPPWEQSHQAAIRPPVEHSRARNLSSSASPSTSGSSYSQMSETSPATQHAASSLGTGPSIYASSGHYPLSGPDQSAAGSERQRPLGIPISSSGGPNVYQMMTLETTSGTVHLPVDVQAASRVADEKRRRNAGASARFRQRRKEKEKEASTTISRLEQQMKEMSEDAEFYRRERDYLAGILTHVPGAERHFPRPLSPRNRRPSTMSLPGPSGTGTAAFPAAQEQFMDSPGEGRNVRRRTSTMSLPPPSAQIAVPRTPNQPAYNQPPFGMPLAPPPLPSTQRGPPSVQILPMGTGPLPPPADIATRQRQQLPALPHVLQPPSQWGSYQSGQPPPDPYHSRGKPS